MLIPRIIPCLDVRDGRVVKGIQFQQLRDAGDPAELAARYESDGADELVVLDVSATLENRIALLETVQKVRAQLSIPLTVGGGVKTLADAQALLNAGADKVSINSAAVRQPELVTQMSQQFGAQCTVVAIDAVYSSDESDWIVVTRSGSQKENLKAIPWAQTVDRLGAGEILLTSFDRDGTRSGYDLELVAAVAKNVSIPVIASGGANLPIHLQEALEAGAHAVLAASIFHDQQISIGQLKQQLAKLGVAVR